MPFMVKELIGGRGLPVTAKEEEFVREALARMLEHDFSQLPVVDDEQRPVGMVTRASILRAMGLLGTKLETLRVGDAMDNDPIVYSDDEELFDLLDELGDTYALLLIDGEKRLTGIVTSYDATEFFRRRYEDLMVIEDIEAMLKELIRTAFTNEAGEVDEVSLGRIVAETAGGRHQHRKSAQQILGRYLGTAKNGIKFDEVLFREVFERTHPPDTSKTLEDLNLGDYIQMFLDEERWDFFREVIGPSREALLGVLDGVRKTRNRLAHFREAPTAEEQERLRFCNELLLKAKTRLSRRHSPRSSSAATPPATGPVPPAPTDQVELGAEMPESSRYSRLALHLHGQPAITEDIELSFARIEEIIGGRLPDSARVHRAWWANDTRSHVQARQWLDVGWRVSDINLREERITFTRMKGREQLYTRFFNELQTALRDKARFAMRPARAPGTSWLWMVDLPEGRPPVAHLAFSFAMRNRFRVELYIDNGNATDNKRLFDQLLSQQGAIAAELGPSLQQGHTSLQWERLNDRRASRVAVYHRGGITDDAKDLEELKVWAVETMLRFYQAIEPRVR